MNLADSNNLVDKRIVVTRPAHQAEPFCRLLERAGANALRCPLLVISPRPNTRSLLRLIEEIDSFDLLLFNSPNAVNFGIAQLASRCNLRGRAKIAAIGAKTAQAITGLGYQVDICPETGFDSESLLQLPILQDVSGMRIAILRGSGGRDLTESVLRSRGAQVIHVKVYDRLPPSKDQFEQIEALLLHKGFDAVTITSGEAFLALWSGSDSKLRHLLNQSAFIVGSRRIADMAQTEGLRSLIAVADDPSDESMFSALIEWSAQAR
ncbi:MAG: uroporphyrinogen-III synthase [Nitrococcus sp.]|nr:uroporphyrinogen-III synthase [Nitrococcus sp.]